MNYFNKILIPAFLAIVSFPVCAANVSMSLPVRAVTVNATDSARTALFRDVINTCRLRWVLYVDGVYVTSRILPLASVDTNGVTIVPGDWVVVSEKGQQYSVRPTKQMPWGYVTLARNVDEPGRISFNGVDITPVPFGDLSATGLELSTATMGFENSANSVVDVSPIRIKQNGIGATEWPLDVESGGAGPVDEQSTLEVICEERSYDPLTYVTVAYRSELAPVLDIEYGLDEDPETALTIGLYLDSGLDFSYMLQHTTITVTPQGASNDNLCAMRPSTSAGDIIMPGTAVDITELIYQVVKTGPVQLVFAEPPFGIMGETYVTCGVTITTTPA